MNSFILDACQNLFLFATSLDQTEREFLKRLWLPSVAGSYKSHFDYSTFKLHSGPQFSGLRLLLFYLFLWSRLSGCDLPASRWFSRSTLRKRSGSTDQTVCIECSYDNTISFLQTLAIRFWPERNYTALNKRHTHNCKLKMPFCLFHILSQLNASQLWSNAGLCSLATGIREWTAF